MAKKRVARKAARPVRKATKATKKGKAAARRRVPASRAKARRVTAGKPKPRSSRTPARPNDLYARVKGAERREIGHVLLEVGKAGGARVKRMIYPAGFRWSTDMKPVVGTELCMHAHVGFLVQGEIHIEYPDGCVIEHRAPQIVAIEPGHDGWVVGKEPVVMIEFDFEGDTVNRLGMPDAHRH